MFPWTTFYHCSLSSGTLLENRTRDVCVVGCGSAILCELRLSVMCPQHHPPFQSALYDHDGHDRSVT